MSWFKTLGKFLHRAGFNPVLIVAQLHAVAFLLGARFPRRWLAAFTAVLVGFFVLRAATGLALPRMIEGTPEPEVILAADGTPIPRKAVPSTRDWDTEVFWYGGKAVLEGKDPYAPNPTPWIALNPPSAFPLFALFATMSMPTLCVVWRAFNVAGSIALVPLAARALGAQAARFGDAWPAPPAEVAMVATTAVLFSTSCVIGIEAGQLAVLASLGIVGALIAQAQGRPILAGALLAVATIKVTMMLPFLLLFLRRGDWKAWAALVAVGLGLSLATQSPAQLVDRVQTYRHLLGVHNAEGGFNDYSYDAPAPNGMIAVDHTLYRLGMRDRKLIGIAQLGILGALGAALAYAVAFRPTMPRMAAISLVTLYANIFLYHRYYDLVLLAIPLAYAMTRARSTEGRPRLLYAASGIAILVALNMSHGPLKKLMSISLESPPPVRWLIQGFMLPYPFWMVALALACLWMAERRNRPEAGAAPAA